MATMYVTVDGQELIGRLISSFEELGLAKGALAIALKIEKQDVCDALARVLDATGTPYHVASEQPAAGVRGQGVAWVIEDEWQAAQPAPVDNTPICIKCGQAFERRRSDQRRCSTCAPKKKAKKETANKADASEPGGARMKQCPYCQEWFTPKTGTQKICGKEDCRKAKSHAYTAMRYQTEVERAAAQPPAPDPVTWVEDQTVPAILGLVEDDSPKHYFLVDGLALSKSQVHHAMNTMQLMAGTLVWNSEDRTWLIVGPNNDLRVTELEFGAARSMMAKIRQEVW